MKKKIAIISTMILISSCCSGCLFLPEEADNREVMVQKNKEQVVVSTDVVLKGDLETQEKIECFYDDEKQQGACFHVNGEKVTDVYVSEGSKVKKGQLLLSTDVKELKEKLAGYKKDMDSNRCDVNYYNKMISLCKKKSEKKQLDMQLTEAKSQLKVSQINYNEIKAEIAKRQVVAPCSGIIRNLLDYSGDTSTKDGQEAVQVASVNRKFRSISEYKKYMKVGANVEIRVIPASEQYRDLGGEDYVENDNPKFLTYKAKIAKVEVKRKTATVTYDLTGRARKFSDGDSASVIFSKTKLRNVTYIPAKDVFTIKKIPYVYLVDDKMFSSAHRIKVDKIFGEYAIISDGLKAGQKVIKKAE